MHMRVQGRGRTHAGTEPRRPTAQPAESRLQRQAVHRAGKQHRPPPRGGKHLCHPREGQGGLPRPGCDPGAQSPPQRGSPSPRCRTPPCIPAPLQHHRSLCTGPKGLAVPGPPAIPPAARGHGRASGTQDAHAVRGSCPWSRRPGQPPAPGAKQTSWTQPRAPPGAKPQPRKPQHGSTPRAGRPWTGGWEELEAFSFPPQRWRLSGLPAQGNAAPSPHHWREETRAPPASPGRRAKPLCSKAP